MPDALVLLRHPTPQIAVVTLHRPEKRNALSIQLMQELVAAVEMAKSSPECRVLIITGSGAVFCSGLDMKEGMDPSTSHASGELVASMLAAVTGCPLVTIAAVQGAAIAGGAGLASACDIVVAAEDAAFAYPEVRRGLAPALVMTILRRRVRDADARELLLLSEPIDAETARRIGLVNRIAKPGVVFDTALSIAEHAMKGAPEAIARTKQLWAELWPRSLAEDLQWALAAHKDMRTSDAAREGMAAFVEKRAPKWDSSGPERDSDKTAPGV